MLDRNDILVTRRSYQVKGALFDQQLMKKGKGQVPVKGSDERLRDLKKYGGYNKETGTYFMLLESENMCRFICILRLKKTRLRRCSILRKREI